MGYHLAIDFGTTNTVAALATDGVFDVLALPGLSQSSQGTAPPLVPSLVYVEDGQQAVTTAGQHVRTRGLDVQPDNRLFRNFKRGIVASPAPPPRLIDSAPWSGSDAGRDFFRHLLDALPISPIEIDQLVLTAPVSAFEDYLGWLSDTLEQIAPDLAGRVRLVDEATTAALGYTVTEPGAVVLVFDFGGGTLGLSLVQLPESKEHTGGWLRRLRLRQHARVTARVIAKAGRVLGGSDIDHWLLTDVLRRAGLTPQALGDHYPTLLTRCEAAKIALSSVESTSLTVPVGDQSHTLTLTRADLDSILEANQFFTALRHVIDSIMHTARQEGVFREDIDAVLMVGGTALMPSVQALLASYFEGVPVRAHKPFTAVVEGALEVAAGAGLDDYLLHSYGLRHLTESAAAHAYEEIIPGGSRCPTGDPYEVILGAAHPDQETIEFVIGEIATNAVSLVEVEYEHGQAVFVASPAEDAQHITPLNATDPVIVSLSPRGTPGEDRLRASFSVDDRRRLHLTVTDLKTRKRSLDDTIIATLR